MDQRPRPGRIPHRRKPAARPPEHTNYTLFTKEVLWSESNSDTMAPGTCGGPLSPRIPRRPTAGAYKRISHVQLKLPELAAGFFLHGGVPCPPAPFRPRVHRPS